METLAARTPSTSTTAPSSSSATPSPSATPATPALSQLLVLGVGSGVVGRWVLLGVGACHSWLRAWWVLLVCLFLCPSGVSGGPGASLAEGCWAHVLWVFLCCVRLWCGQCSRFGVLCAFVGLVLPGAVAVRVVCARGCVLMVLLGACPGLSGDVLAALCGRGAVCRGPSLALAVGPGCGSPPAPFCVLPPLILCRIAWGAVPLVTCPGLPGLWWVCGGAGWNGGGGVLAAGSGPFPWCLPSGCNSVIRAVHLYPLGKYKPAP